MVLWQLQPFNNITTILGSISKLLVASFWGNPRTPGLFRAWFTWQTFTAPLYRAWKNSWHFTTPSVFSLLNEVWETSAGIPYWWCVTTQIWVVRLEGGGGGDNWVNFCWVCAAGLSEPLSIIVYSVANYKPHVSHFLFIYLQSATKLLRHCTQIGFW